MTVLRWPFGLIVILSALLLAAGCATTTPATNATPSAVPGEPGLTVIHALVDETGADAVLGESAKAALALAERDLNDHYARIGSEHRVRVVVNDTGTDPVRALTQLKALDEAGVKLVLGLLTSEEVRALKPYADEHGILLVVTGSSAAELSADDQVLRLCPNDRQQAAALAQYLHDEGIAHLVPVQRGDLWGDGLVNETRAAFGNGTVALGVRYDPTTTDFGPIVDRLDAAVGHVIAEYGENSTGVHAVTFKEIAPLMSAASRAPNLSRVRWFGSDGNALVPDVTADPTVAAFAEKTRFIAPIMGTVGSASAGARVGDDLRVALNRTPDVQALGIYDAAWIVASVADQGTGTTATAVKEAFVETADRFKGTSGEGALTAEGDRLVPVYDFWAVGSVDGSARWEKSGWSAEWVSGTFRFIPLNRTSPKP